MKTCLLFTVRNRSTLLRRTFEELTTKTIPNEVLVIDDGGTDDTHAVCQEFDGRLPIRYVYHRNPGMTLCSEARNVGLKLTDADAIITCEPEVYFVTDVIAQMLFLHYWYAPNEVINAGLTHWEGRNGSVAEERKNWFAPYACFYMHDWLMEVGGWDEGFPGPWGWDDTDLLTRLSRSGHEQIRPEQIEVRHQYHPPFQGDQFPNAHYFEAKDLYNSDEFIVANEGKEWGVLKP